MIPISDGAGIIAPDIAAARGIAVFDDLYAFAEQSHEVHDLCIHVLAEALEPQPVRGKAP